ncbi:hypothetical protein BFP76_07365 [Amylibacter kogurei]|uniref:Pectate lyase superfamily protein domain-containing protein n=1 Tax=Paramylibacter kogurei TaxID=1889778 RepID=A0A2G5K8E7_9RHOB|nr:right-handed parallel beta-helix repeat-containing protein [Amylibacter kogurei]PIB24964.1 hypothetical protein BFP76_07365 [Amylibacter kogurei]
MPFGLYKKPTYITFGSSGGGGGFVSSVNAQTGAVLLDTSHIEPSVDRNYVSDAQLAAIGTAGDAAGVFETLVDLRVASDIAIGDVVMTKGYHTAGDAGAARYEIVAANTGVDDGGSFIDLTGVNLQARAIFNGPVTLEQFGAIGDGQTSAVSALIAADAVSDHILLQSGGYLIDANTSISAQMHFIGGWVLVTNAAVLSLPLPQAGLEQIFDLQSGGVVDLVDGDVVHPEWWGGGATSIQRALDQSAVGARVALHGEYPIAGLAISDTHAGKSIVGADTGTQLQLIAGADVAAVSFDTIAGDVNVTLRNLVIDANKTGQGVNDINGIDFNGVSGVVLENIAILNAAQDGMAFLGADNNVTLLGKVEIAHSGRDGIDGTRVGTSQFNADIHCHHNTGRGVVIGAYGQVNAGFIKAENNGGEGVVWTCENPSYIHLLQCQDNGMAGLHYAGDALVIGTAIMPDNGVIATTTTTQCGVSDQGKHLRIRTLANPSREGADIVHNQKTLYFGNSIGAVVQTVNDTATQVNQVASGQTLNIFNTRRNLLGPKIIERRSYSGSLTEHNAIPYGFRPIQCPDIYGAVHIFDVGVNYYVTDTNLTRSSNGSQLELRISASADVNLNWGSSYRGADGNPLPATQMQTGQDYDFAFIRRAANWFLIP